MFLSAELRPPQAGLSGPRSMDDWIDTYHSIRRLTLAGRHVFLTDNAVGRHEEENLRHLVANLGPDARRSHIIPFLTTKHSVEYCLRYAERAYEHGFRTLVVLGGDRHDGVPRCVEHAYQLRRMIRDRVPGLSLGGWANPHKDVARQVEFLVHPESEADFYLTQIVSHHHSLEIVRFKEAIEKSGCALPALFGVFYYRSARRATLETLRRFFPVPESGLQRDFEHEKLDADTVCARSVRTLWNLGVRRFYISNLPIADAAARLERILSLATEGLGSRRGA
jgi:hypothetical protein